MCALLISEGLDWAIIDALPAAVNVRGRSFRLRQPFDMLKSRGAVFVSYRTYAVGVLSLRQSGTSLFLFVVFALVERKTKYVE
jgi:hypothetical protein